MLRFRYWLNQIVSFPSFIAIIISCKRFNRLFGIRPKQQVHEPTDGNRQPSSINMSLVSESLCS